MGGRGASSGKSKKGNEYGSQYHTVLQDGDIKFVTKNSRSSEPLMETMTPGRVYVETGGDDLLRVISFDEENKRNRVLERDKRNDSWHVHSGYYHSEYGSDQHGELNQSDQELLAKIKDLWDKYRRGIV